MGSFANSLHVKSRSGDEVAASITEILRGEGWRPTQKLPGRRESFSLPRTAGAAGFGVSGGWVSILDSDLAGIHSLTADRWPSVCGRTRSSVS